MLAKKVDAALVYNSFYIYIYIYTYIYNVYIYICTHIYNVFTHTHTHTKSFIASKGNSAAKKMILLSEVRIPRKTQPI